MASNRFDTRRAFAFLKGLAKNNDRDWFVGHKDEWQEIAADFEALIGQVFQGMKDIDPGLAKVPPRKAIFRLNRDVRFSKDKSPYKTHLAAIVSSAGKRPDAPGAYLSIGPNDQTQVGVGLYEPEKDQAERVRKAIARDAAPLHKILAAPVLGKLFGGLQGDSYVRVPKPYDPDHPEAELLRRKNFFVWHTIADTEMLKADAAKLVVEHLRAAEPLRAWLAQAGGGIKPKPERRA